MGNKRGPRNIGPQKFIKAWLTEIDPEKLAEAYRKEASREVTEMLNWKIETEKYDPYAYVYEDEIFPLIDKANRYRMRIYDQGKKIKVARAAMTYILANSYGNDPETGFKKDERVIKAQEDWREAEDEQIRLCWRIKKIHSAVKAEVRVNLTADDPDPFAEYEYDPEA